MLLAKAIKKRAELAPELVTYFDWLLDSFDQRYFGEGLGIDFQDEDSGKLMVTPYLLQKVEGGLKLSIAIRYPVTVTEKQVTAGLKKQFFREVSFGWFGGYPELCMIKMTRG